MKLPRRSGIFPIGFGISEVTLRATSNIRFPIAVDVRERRRFVIHHVKDDMLLPMTLATARIFIPGSFFAGETVNHNVRPTVAIKIVRERKEIIGVSVSNSERGVEAREVFF